MTSEEVIKELGAMLVGGIFTLAIICFYKACTFEFPQRHCSS